MCEIGGDCFGLRYFSEGAQLSCAPEEKYQGPKQSPMNSHNDQNKDGAKLLLSLIMLFRHFEYILGVIYEEIIY